MRPRVKPVDPEKVKKHKLAVRPHTTDAGVIIVECSCGKFYKSCGGFGQTVPIERVTALASEHKLEVSQ